MTLLLCSVKIKLRLTKMETQSISSDLGQGIQAFNFKV